MNRHEFTNEELRRVKRKINRLLDEKNYPEAAKLMVAMAVVKMDPHKFARQLVQKIQEYKSSKSSGEVK